MLGTGLQLRGGALAKLAEALGSIPLTAKHKTNKNKYDTYKNLIADTWYTTPVTC